MMSESKDQYTMLNMNRDDLSAMLEMIFKEGWVESQESINALFDLDPEGFFKGVVDNQMISVICAVRYPKNYGFIGLYIVRPDFRGKRYGIRLFNHALKHLEGCLIGLDAVPSRVDTYKKIGFVFDTNSNRYLGRTKHCEVQMTNNIVKYDESKHFDDISMFDIDCCPSERTQFLKNWLKMQSSYSCVSYNTEKEITGYASMHLTKDGWEIAPCYADSMQIASDLIRYLLNLVDENLPFWITCPDNNENALNLVQSLQNEFQFQMTFSDKRMYKNGYPTNMNPKKIYSYLSLSVG